MFIPFSSEYRHWFSCIDPFDTFRKTSGHYQIAKADELNEYRMSNKVYPPSAAPEATREFRMMKFNYFGSLLRRSTFAVLHSAVRF